MHLKSTKTPRRLQRHVRATAHAALLSLSFCSAALAQETLSDAEKARLAASDEGADMPLAIPTLPFGDTFEGSSLSADWTVLNENRDKYLPDNGAVFALQTGGKAHPGGAGAENIFALNRTPPNEDFDISLDVKFDPKSGYDDIWLGLWNDRDDYLAANVSVHTNGCGPQLRLSVENKRILDDSAKPVTTGFSSNLFDGPLVKHICGKGARAAGDLVLAALNQTGFTLTLSRRGMQYSARIDFTVPQTDAFEAGPRSFSSRAVSRLAPFGQPFFMLGQAGKAKNGETTALFEEFSITAAQ
ncbi:MAG: hypothetical protein RIC18_06525 [Hoeflea sp.]|uniref:hypothetical protein n=1 Tax=Hoeflea sp. TaxID=1940281 RepID=UPI0032EF37B5